MNRLPICLSIERSISLVVDLTLGSQPISSIITGIYRSVLARVVRLRRTNIAAGLRCVLARWRRVVYIPDVLAGPVVTIVVVPRERFTYAPQCLESLYAHTDVPFHLVWVDGGSPSSIRHYLRAQAAVRGFELVQTDHYLWPNRARNLGLRRVRTPYVVFMDNDVVVAPEWLGALVRCADETGATVVGPLN
jgi:hypothetical protein